MGYTKYYEFGDKFETFQYDKEIHPQTTHKTQSRIEKKRRKDIKEHNKKIGYVPTRSKSSTSRARSSFFRLVHHNNCSATSIHFLTLTFAYEVTYKEATRAIAHFFQRIKQTYSTPTREVSVSYISVPELTKKGRYHFHILVYNLPSDIAGDPISIRRWSRRKRCYIVEYATTERFTRNLQRLFRRGYLDLGFVPYISEGLAGYMAKYMAKNITDPKNEAVRGYTCSRNINKITVAGANDISVYTDLLVNNMVIDRIDEYETMYLGRCLYKKYSKN